jgi:hypothetical protein
MTKTTTITDRPSRRSTPIAPPAINQATSTITAPPKHKIHKQSHPCILISWPVPAASGARTETARREFRPARRGGG